VRLDHALKGNIQGITENQLIISDDPADGVQAKEKDKPLKPLRLTSGSNASSLNNQHLQIKSDLV
jgi:hypothetical protein